METMIGLVVLVLFAGSFLIVMYFMFIRLPETLEKQASIDLQAWAAREGLHVISHRRARAGQAGFLIVGLVEFRILVEDGAGKRRSGWASFDGGYTPPEKVRVRWEQPVSPGKS